MRSAKKISLAVLAISGIIFSSGCTTAKEPNEQSEVQLKIGTSTEVTNWTPLNSFSTTDWWLTGQHYPALFELTSDGKINPHLATGFEVSSDGSEVTLKLSDKFSWSDGAAITSADVKFTLDRFVSDKLLSGSSIAYNYAGSKIVSDTEIILSLKVPSYGWVIDLVQSASVLPEHVFAEVADLANYPVDQHPESWVSGGSYVLSSIVPGQSYSFVPNQYYPLRAAGNERISEVVFKIYPDMNSMILALKTADIDLIAPVVPVAALSSLTEDLSVGIESVANGLNYTKLSFNASRPALSDPVVRRVISGLIDTEKYAEVLLQGYGQSLTGPVLPSYKDYQNPIKPWKYTPAEAKALLKSAGYDQLSLKLVCDSGNVNHSRYAQLIADALAAADIHVQLNCMERSTSLTQAKAGEFDLYIHKLSQSWSPGTNLVQQYDPANPSGLYYFFAKDAELSNLSTAITTAATESEYKLAVRSAADYLHDEAYVLPLYVEALNSVYAKDRFTGFIGYGTETMTMSSGYSLAQVVPVRN